MKRLRERKVAQWGFAYLAGSWVLLQVIALLAEPFGWPQAQVVRTATVVLVVLFFAALVLAWYHGERGQQRTTATELGLLAVILIAALTSGFLAWRSSPRSAPDVAGGSAVPNSIAVLPFADMSAAKDQAYFTDGITEEILNVLAGIDGLRVAARTSSFQFKNHNLDMREIGQRLNVAHLLEGSIQKSGERLRITAQLIDARTGYHLWSNRWDRAALADIFEIEDEIARSIAQVLREKLSLNVTAGEARQRVDPKAHDLYLRGVALTHTSDENQIRQAIDLFRQALRIDPDYADAHGGIAYSYMVMADAYLPPREAYPLALEAGRRAVAIDSTHANGLAALGYAGFVMERKLDRSMELLRSAVRHNPNSVEALMLHSNIACSQVSYDEAMQSIQKARLLDPYSVALLFNEEFCLLYGARYDEAIQVHQQMRRLAPDLAYIDDAAAAAYRAKGDFNAALREYDHVAPGPAVLFGKAITYARMGRTAEARTYLARLQEESTKRYLPPSMIAAVQAQLGDFDAALQSLEKADQAGDMLALYFYKGGHTDFAPLAQNPRTAARIKAFLH